MIIREQNDGFVIIRQHDHAIISEQMAKKLKQEFHPDEAWRDSVFYAIKMHDYGWKDFDAEPLWDDEKQSPYSFIDFPNRIKTVLYKHGIDEVAKEDVYAGLLCSRHYVSFLAKDSSPEAIQFVIDEKDRQKSIQDKLGIADELVSFHYDLLRFADSLSLFLCLNEPGARKEEMHYFFQNGIPLPGRLQKQLGERLHLEWADRGTVVGNISTFQDSFTVSVPFKKVSNAAIAEHGIRKSYMDAVEGSLEVRIV